MFSNRIIIIALTSLVCVQLVNYTECASIEPASPSNNLGRLKEIIRGYDPNSNWCCKIDPPNKPIFADNGDLIDYKPQPCPLEYKTCCKGHMNILGYCIRIEEVAEWYPEWQNQAQSQGISLLEVIDQHLIG